MKLPGSVVLALVMTVAAASAACGADAHALGGAPAEGTPESSQEQAATTGAPQASPGETPTNSQAGKTFFSASVFPFLAQKCGGCHEAKGVGNPAWVDRANAAKTYDLVFANGWVIPVGSRLVDKGVHSGGAAPALTDDEKAKVAQWVATETKDGGKNAQVNVLEKFGGCLDANLFAQIGLDKLVTTRRTKENNLNQVANWEENANTCTGCEATPCRACHSLDDATGFVMAIGNPNVPANMTFEETKKILPPYLQKYVGTGPDGKPVASGGLEKKSEATRRDRAYTHPLYVMPPDMKARLDAFVADALAKYAAGTCGK